jgi:hypothetical protein
MEKNTCVTELGTFYPRLPKMNDGRKHLCEGIVGLEVLKIML